jgi:penicillin-binding protein 1A
MMKEVGTAAVKDIAMRVGIDADVREELSTALGTVDMSLLDLVGGYATIGQKGVFTSPFGILKIETKSGQLIYEYKEKSPARVISKRHTDAITAMMQDVVMYGTGQRAQTGFPIAGKTGTTQDYRDAVFIGFSSVYTMGVWTGNDDNSSLGRGSYGGGVPAGIWRQSMIAAHQGVPAGSVTDYSAGSLTFDNLIGGFFKEETTKTKPESNQKNIYAEEKFEFNQ